MIEVCIEKFYINVKPTDEYTIPSLEGGTIISVTIDNIPGEFRIRHNNIVSTLRSSNGKFIFGDFNDNDPFFSLKEWVNSMDRHLLNMPPYYLTDEQLNNSIHMRFGPSFVFDKPLDINRSYSVTTEKYVIYDKVSNERVFLGEHYHLDR